LRQSRKVKVRYYKKLKSCSIDAMMPPLFFNTASALSTKEKREEEEQSHKHGERLKFGYSELFR
jgi:hypothetical protein